MNRISDEDLILYYYDEAEDAQTIAARLEGSSALRQRYATLCLVLDAVDSEPAAERPAAYGSRVWHRIAPEIEASGRRPRAWRWLRPRREWALATVLVLLLLTAFLAGRMVPRTDVQVASGLSHEGRDRILLMTVAGHLERSEMLLLELVNSVSGDEVDLSLERQLATELGHENRLYRQAAQRAGRADVATLLEQLETVLVELANAPETVPAADLGEFQMRLADGNVLFKVRVVGSRLRRETEVPDGVAAPRSVPVDL